MFLLSNEVMRELVTTNHTPNEQAVTEALWKRFCEEADINRVSGRGAWTIADAKGKARVRLQELENGVYDFVSRSDRTTLVAGSGKVERPKPIGATQAQDELDSILDEFFEGLADGASPRAAIRLTMGTGKTQQTIANLNGFSGSLNSFSRLRSTIFWRCVPISSPSFLNLSISFCSLLTTTQTSDSFTF